MRVAAILGPGLSPGDLKPFQKACPASWSLGLPERQLDAEAVLVFGGDGTIHRHLATLADLQLPILVVPCGSGNDFARALGLRNLKSALQAWQSFARSGQNIRIIDLGSILRPDGGSTLYCCIAGAGLDSEVTRRANRLPSWLRGNGGYALVLPGALASFAPANLITTIAADGKPIGEPATRRAFFIAIANAPAYGGGMKIAPRARLDDGQLDICIIRELPKWRFLRHFPSVYSGRHLQIPEVEYFQTPQLALHADRPLDVYADGEFVCQTPIEVTIAPQKLPVITP